MYTNYYNKLCKKVNYAIYQVPFSVTIYPHGGNCISQPWIGNGNKNLYKTVSNSCKTSDCKNYFIFTFFFLYPILFHSMYSNYYFHTVFLNLFFTTVVNCRMIYPRWKHVTPLDTQTLLSKCSSVLTETYFVYYTITTQWDITYKENNTHLTWERKPGFLFRKLLQQS